MVNIENLTEEEAKKKLYFIMHHLGNDLGYSISHMKQAEKLEDEEFYKWNKGRKTILSRILSVDFQMTDEEIAEFIKEWNY